MEVFALQQQLADAGTITCAMREAIGNLSGVYAEWDRRQNKMLTELALKRSILDCVSSGVSVSDATHPEMPLLFVNRAFERMTGYSREENGRQELPLPAGTRNGSSRRRPHPASYTGTARTHCIHEELP